MYKILKMQIWKNTYECTYWKDPTVIDLLLPLKVNMPTIKVKKKMRVI